MSTNRSMSRGATGELGSRTGTANFSDAGSGWTEDTSRSSTVAATRAGVCACCRGSCIIVDWPQQRQQVQFGVEHLPDLAITGAGSGIDGILARIVI